MNTRWAHRILLLTGVVAFAAGWRDTTEPSNRGTVVLVVRHAEKATAPSQDPPLTAAGMERAKALAHMVSKTGVEAIFASQFARTQQTVQPLAKALNLPITQIDAANVQALVTQMLGGSQGKIVLVAGHSDTVPQIIAALGGGSIDPIAETEFDNLFVVHVPPEGAARVVHLQYGQPSP